MKANCLASATNECNAAPSRLTYGTSPLTQTTHPFSSLSLSHSPRGSEDERPTQPTTTPSHTTVHQPGPKTNPNNNNKNNTNIDNETKDGMTEPPHHTTHSPEHGPVSLPVIYVILIVASSLSFILVVSGELSMCSYCDLNL